MSIDSAHKFHIPVLGLSYSIDTPLKVARYGITSVVSIIEDELIEKMREFHCEQNQLKYVQVSEKDFDYRAKRITAYLDLLDNLVKLQSASLKKGRFESGSEIEKYFKLLPDDCDAKRLYQSMQMEIDAGRKSLMQLKLRECIVPGKIDVNIMSKVDNLNYSDNGDLLPVEFSDALSALRGFANSSLNSSVIFSAGYNPRLYSYIESFSDFFPDENGILKKKVILKVSDFRSAQIQGKILAKKGIWISEFRIESGMNCGGHAFPTDGFLLGPILEEFRCKRKILKSELYDICVAALNLKTKHSFREIPEMKVTVQGGIGTSNENKFLLDYFQLDATGWGSPFLLVPEVTNVEENTLLQLSNAKKEDYFLSEASPLGVPFHNFRKSSSEDQRKERIRKNRPGSPCYKKFLSSNTEFTETPICTASRQYQNLKIAELKEKKLPELQLQDEIDVVLEKDCLCEGLGTSVLLKNKIPVMHKLKAVTICPGPNLAYFSGVFSLLEMTDHIYGRKNILNDLPRPNMFVNEAQLYIDYLKKAISRSSHAMSIKQFKYLSHFKLNLNEGLEYYKSLLSDLKNETEFYLKNMYEQLQEQQSLLSHLFIPEPQTPDL